MILIVWMLLLTAVSLYPFKGGPSVPGADKVLHAGLYAVTAMLFFSYLIKKFSFRRAIILSLILPVIYGMLMEVAQTYTGREFSFWDGAANTVGAAAGVLFIGFKRRWR
jgi:VanZ family protein